LAKEDEGANKKEETMRSTYVTASKSKTFGVCAKNIGDQLLLDKVSSLLALSLELLKPISQTDLLLECFLASCK